MAVKTSPTDNVASDMVLINPCDAVTKSVPDIRPADIVLKAENSLEILSDMDTLSLMLL